MHKDSPKMQFLEADDFILDLQNELNSGFAKLKIICFKLTYHSLFKKIYPLVFHGLKNKGEVSFELDGYFSRDNLTGNGFYPLKFGSNKNKEVEAKKQLDTALEKLMNAGAKITFLNTPTRFNKNIFPFAGRDHRKVIFLERQGQKIAYFGAVNLDEGEKNDYMIKVQDEKFHDKLYEINSLNFLQLQKHDVSVELDENTKILLDLGGNLKSNIQHTAYEMMHKAQKIIRYVNQLPPEPHMLVAFILARSRGVKVEVVIPEFKEKTVSGFPFIFMFLFGFLVSKLFGISILHCNRGFTHAKILICDEEMLLGSHNLSLVGIASGTRELSVSIKDSNLLKDVNNFVDDISAKKMIPSALPQLNLNKNEIRKK